MSVIPPKKNGSELAQAATALEAELFEYEKFVADVRRMSINSDKSMNRAKSLLEDCAAGEQRMADRLQAFAAAVQNVQTRQQECIKEAVEAAKHIQDRMQNRTALLSRFQSLVERARSLNDPVTALEAKEGSAKAQDLLTTLGQVAVGTEGIIAEAEALSTDAQTSDWQDVAREATTLKQQLQSARNKILVAQRDVANRTPS